MVLTRFFLRLLILSGVNIVRDACQHEVIGKYIHKVMFDELMETLNLPKDELEKFAR